MENKRDFGDKFETIAFILIVFLVGYFIITNLGKNKNKFNPEELSNKYYYNQLNSGYKEYGKIFYEKLYENKNYLKKGNKELTLTAEYILNKKYKDINSDDKKKLTTSFSYARLAFLYDNPDIFWLYGNNLLYDNFEIKSVKNQNYYIEGIQSEDDIKTMESKLNESISGIMKELEKLNDDYSKIKRVHDYLCETITYDSNAKYKYNIYGALVDKKCVCQGYALAFQYFMNNLGIESIYVVGEGYKNLAFGWIPDHAWNYVKLNNKWYAVDTTWDDVENGISYQYFLKGSKVMNENHTTDTKHQFFDPLKNVMLVDFVEEPIKYPDLSENDYE